jgi:hypothetical protein
MNNFVYHAIENRSEIGLLPFNKFKTILFLKYLGGTEMPSCSECHVDNTKRNFISRTNIIIEIGRGGKRADMPLCVDLGPSPQPPLQ